MQTKNYNKRIKYVVTKAKTKDGELMPKDTTEHNISAVSFYYMLDKDSWQMKIWLFPTNRSKTYNLPVKEDSISTWMQVFKSINTYEDDEFKETNDEW